MAQLTYITDPDRWDRFVCAHPCGHFLQTWAWGALKAQFGWQPVRLALCDGEQWLAGAQILFRKFPLGAMGYVPKGPLIAPDSPHWRQWLDALREVAHANRAYFLRLEPEWESGQAPPAGLVPNPTAAVQPQTTIQVDLRLPPDEILARMKQKWRYNIRLAERKGITVRIGGEADLATFYALSEITAQRDHFAIHSEDYYRAAWRLFDAEHAVALFVAAHEGRALASIFVVACGRTAIYLYGASSDAERQRMPNHLLQWRAMLWAKERGCVLYDLWGIPSIGDSPDRLPEGLLKFKEGFGGRVVRYAGAFDVVYNRPLYRVLDYLIARRRGLA